jgi:hypothetical protein
MTCVGVALSVNTTVKDRMVTSFESTKMFSSRRWKISESVLLTPFTNTAAM